ncbi:unnamed protein product [Owenia fusiformis]|uniref:Uncharacterized protein n=1 Tax=Owenia fusiformis TaxID=6347 RepID=A0A8J1XGQ4_OWEFU|nr:unnamed protein product [Owenia fusiformis]
MIEIGILILVTIAKGVLVTRKRDKKYNDENLQKCPPPMDLTADSHMNPILYPSATSKLKVAASEKGLLWALEGPDKGIHNRCTPKKVRTWYEICMDYEGDNAIE